MTSRDRTVSFVTLGCKLNYAETSTFGRRLSNEGFTIVDYRQKAAWCVVNTCSVTEHSDKKCRNLISRIARLNPECRIVVTGCYASLSPASIAAMPGVVAVFGYKDKARVVDFILEACERDSIDFTPALCDFDPIAAYHASCAASEPILGAYSSGQRTRSFLKVQDGCNYCCSYCTVPYARGHSRSISIAQAVEAAWEIASLGIREIVLTGVNTGDFGSDSGETFLDLLKSLNEIDGIERYRISSIEPNLLTDETIHWIASGTKFLPHFHIPLQSGCDRILEKMGRHYDTSFFASKIEYIRRHLGRDVFIGIDVIVGFPGETDEDFQATYRFLEDLAPAFIHIFPYSRRSGTIAATMPKQVQDIIKTFRVQKLEELCAQLHAEFVASCRERVSPVLFESYGKDGMMAGYTDNYIYVRRPYAPEMIGQIVDITLGEEDAVYNDMEE